MKTEDEKQLRALIEQFITGWAEADQKKLEETMSDCLDADFSIFDAHLDRSSFIRQLCIRTRKPDYTRFELYNYVCAANAREAQISCVIAGLFADETPASFYFNFFMGASVQKINGNWEFTRLFGELGSGSDQHTRLYSDGVRSDYSGGDTSFIANWHNITHTIGYYPGSRLLCIVPEYDAPWYAISNRTTESDDAEQIEELMYKYCYALDHDIIRLYNDVFSDDLQAVYSGDRLYNKRGCTAMLKFERTGMIGRGHIVYFDHLKIDGDIAAAHLYRAGYIPAELCTGENKYKNWPCARYDMKFRKEDGIWHILNLNYLDGRVERPWPDTLFKVTVSEMQSVR